ncbi:hypothetical protein [Bathymodiolus japonicus methanotrophic gill symbiont]|nr:hypothetical protein [Bathymodiolus japonicus methanotrophic gill symbiont]
MAGASPIRCVGNELRRQEPQEFREVAWPRFSAINVGYEQALTL